MAPPLNILLAEDERSVALAVTFALEAEGHAITVVPDGEQALAHASGRHIDLLITDYQMPKVNGLDLVRQLRATSFKGGILVLSAHVSAENRVELASLGVDAVLPKPFDLHSLRSIVRSLNKLPKAIPSVIACAVLPWSAFGQGIACGISR